MICPEWSESSLAEVGRCLRGVSYDPGLDLSDVENATTVRLLRSNNVQDSRLILSDIQIVSRSRVSDEQYLRPHDIVLCMANGSRALVGKSGLYVKPETGTYTFGAFMGCFRTEQTKAVPRFVRFLFLTKQYQDAINNLLAGSAINNLSPASVESLRFQMPPLAEQWAIAEALSDADALVESLDALIAKKRDMKQAAMQQLLTGRTRLPGFKQIWERACLGDLGEISGAGVDKKIEAGELPVRLVNYLDVYRKSKLSSSDLTQWVSARHDQLRRCEVRKGDVFFTPTSEVPGDICNSAVAIQDIPDAVYSYHLVRLRLQDNWDLRFRAYAFGSKDFMDQATRAAEGSGTRYVVTLPRFRALSIRFPVDLLEQGAIGAVLSDMDSEIDALVAQREKAELVKQGMMQELLSGRVRLV